VTLNNDLREFKGLTTSLIDVVSISALAPITPALLICTVTSVRSSPYFVYNTRQKF